MTGTDVDADGTGGEDGDSAVSRRGRLHIAGRIGNARMPDGKLQPMDEGEVVQRVAVSPVQWGLCMKTDGQLKGVLSWHTFVMSQCARVVRIHVSCGCRQNKGTPGFTEFGLRILMGLVDYGPVRAASDVAVGLGNPSHVRK